MGSLIDEMRAELIRAREQISFLQQTLAKVKCVICDDDPEGDIVSRLERFARVEAAKLRNDRLRDAFDSGADAMLERLIYLSAKRVITRETLIDQQRQIKITESQLEGRP